MTRREAVVRGRPRGARGAAACTSLLASLLAGNGLADTVAEPLAPGAPRASAPPLAEEQARWASYAAVREWREGDPPPPGYHLEPRPFTGMILGGAIPLGVAYAMSVAVATGADYSGGSAWLVLPVVGPWITALTMPRERCTTDYDLVQCETNGPLRGLAVFDGMVQALGATLVIVGVTTEKHRLVRDSWGLTLRPARVGTGYGLGLSGAL